ncbi:MAG TPA: hypothetical protein VN688_32730 [Gemmataceae bacterium]|nr:hypothetical protein [Gemmataceae bacterium]
MTLVCRNCSRVNPPEANYCYWDGAVLDGRAQANGPIAVGAQPFLSPFVFPSGRQCRNLNELVLACYSEWKEALDLLRQGYLEGFFGALGRVDLALAAKQAMKAADLDRGLDDLLSKLPCSTREPAKLFAQPQEVNLGQISRSGDRQFVLHIENQGMGLLQGTVACDETAWLALGEGTGSPRKVFQCLDDFTLPVQIHGKALRAGNKTLEGRLTIESNGGSVVIVVRADVPVQPFPDGVLSGAISPRQIAEKAKANPKGAAPSFEKGAVAAWYESNGWTYPVQGPASSGLGAIQQFFEALGLVKAPVVEISETAVQLHGAPGASLEHVLQVRAVEKRPVFAHATTGTPWLQIGRIVLDGRTARIVLKVPNVPACPGEKLQGKVQVTANGGQRFLVEVSLTISGRMAVHVNPMAAAAVLDMDQVLAVVPVHVVSERETIPEVLAVTEEAPVSVHRGRDEVLEVLSVPVGGTTHGRRREANGDFDRKVSRIHEPSSGGIAKHLLPLGILALMLLIVVVHDLWIIVRQPAGTRAAETALVDPDPYIAIRFHDKPDDKLPMPTMRFGLVMLRVKDPARGDRLKRLTFDEHGRSNNTCLRVDGKDYLFGQPPGEWIAMKGKLEDDRDGRPRDGLASSWWLPNEKIKVTQEVEIVPGEQSRRLDTCLVRYLVENKDLRGHQVGIRFMLDTFIGFNDGVPFTIPGATDLCDTKKLFKTSTEVPDFIQALEKDDLRDPGTVAYLQFRIGKQVESPGRVMLGGWPNPELQRAGWKTAKAQLTGWDVPFLSIKERVGRQSANDSAVTMYWDPQPLTPNQTRVVGFAYGLGDVDTRESEGHLLLTVGGRLVRKGEFTLTALVHNPQRDEELQLTLPSGFSILEGSASQKVPPVPAGATRPDSPVTWRIRAGDDGKYELAVRSNKGAKQKLPLTIRTRGVFD